MFLSVSVSANSSLSQAKDNLGDQICWHTTSKANQVLSTIDLSLVYICLFSFEVPTYVPSIQNVSAWAFPISSIHTNIL
jgi:hypothetical protein